MIKLFLMISFENEAKTVFKGLGWKNDMVVAKFFSCWCETCSASPLRLAQVV